MGRRVCSGRRRQEKDRGHDDWPRVVEAKTDPGEHRRGALIGVRKIRFGEDWRQRMGMNVRKEEEMINARRVGSNRRRHRFRMASVE